VKRTAIFLKTHFHWIAIGVSLVGLSIGFLITNPWIIRFSFSTGFGLLFGLIILNIRRTIQKQKIRIRHLQTLLITDEKTGLYNYRHFDDCMEREILDKNPFSVIAFKVAVQNQLLEKTGQYLNHLVKKPHIAARVGKNKFALIFLRVGEQGALTLGREIMDGIENEIGIDSSQIRARIATYHPRQNMDLEENSLALRKIKEEILGRTIWRLR